jgi:hypothetical protein
MAATAAEDVAFQSATEAYRQGMAAAAAGKGEKAVEPLSYAAEHGVLGAQLKLARMFATGQGVPRDDAKALSYYQQIADQRADTSLLSPLAPYIAEAFVAVGRYYLNGVPAAGLAPNAREAAGLFRHAASYFGDPDAQYELARLYLAGNGVEKNVSLAVNWLANAAKKQHPQSQALLGELLWRGEEVRKRPARGLALITLARENSKNEGEDKAWIEALYLEVIAGADEALAKKAAALAERWRDPSAKEAAAIAPETPAAQSPTPQLVVPASGASAEPAPAPAAPLAAPAAAPQPGLGLGVTLGLEESAGPSRSNP